MNVSNQAIRLAVFIFVTIILLACGGGGGGGNNAAESDQEQPVTGRFVDSAVEGVRYVSGSQEGFTDIEGTFEYFEGNNVQFYIGDILIGEAEAKSIITPIDLVTGAADLSDPAVTNIIRFLQTLDDDRNPENGITITSAVFDLAINKSVDFSLSIDDFENNSEIQILVNELSAATTAGASALVSTESAQAHLSETLFVENEELFGISISGDDVGAINSFYMPNNIVFTFEGESGEVLSVIWGDFTTNPFFEDLPDDFDVKPLSKQLTVSELPTGIGVTFTDFSSINDVENVLTENSLDDIPYYAYVCSISVCSGVSINKSARIVTFDNVVLTASGESADDDNVASGFIEINGQILY